MSDRPTFAVLHTSDTTTHLTHRTRVRDAALDAAQRLKRAAFLEGEDVQAVELVDGVPVPIGSDQ